MTVVSIIIPLYNGVEYLEECVRSVIAQTFTDWEVIIGINGHGADGGSVAPIANQIAALDSRIKVIIQPPPLRGKIESSHDLVNKSKATWICMLDCDDKWEPTKLEKQVEALNTVAKDAMAIGTFCRYFGDLSGNIPVPAGYIHPSDLEKTNPIVNSSAMIHRDYCFWKDEEISQTMEDYSLWMDISLQGQKLYNVPEHLTWHRIHTTSAFNSKHMSNIPLRTRYSQLYKQMILREISYENTYSSTISRINQFINFDAQSIITFVIPSTNRPDLSRTLSSLLEQSKTNWRAIVVFYGCEPLDSTILSMLQDSRFLYLSIKRKEDIAHGQAGYVRNVGLQFICNTNWVGFIDEGDILTPAYMQCLEDEENTTPSTDAVLFKMKCDNYVFPPFNYRDIIPNMVGISFVIRSYIVAQGYAFKLSTSEDFAFLNDLQRTGRTIVMSPSIVYCVKDAVHEAKDPSDSSPRWVINPKVLS